MAMVDMRDLLQHAYSNRYAVGAFEIVSLDFLQAIIEAAETARSPVILNIVEPHFGLYDLDLLMTATIRAAKRASVPVAVHMDHCSSLETVQTAMRLGCNGVKLDAASESFPVNVQRTREVVDMAHAWGIPVEGEIGYVTGMSREDSESNSDVPVYTHVEEAKAYIEKTGVDFLAVSIGTVHGRVKGKPRLDYTRLARIQEKFSIPCVIHGGTGLGEQQYRKLIDHGVAKINYFTALAETNAKQLEANLKNKEMSYQQVFADVREKLSEEVKHHMQVLNSAGRAAEVLMQCRSWRNVENVICYNPDTEDQGLIEEMLTKGQQDLIQIPGVLNVEIGRSIDSNSQYNYCWLVSVANEEVLKSYKAHPIYENYTKKVSMGITVNDFEILDAVS
ncbi:MAG: class II fructose-bisphosphate aldolase [Gammaproteobacteria bacterium]|jgi:fructose-bisphosphate aldolase, class II